MSEAVEQGLTSTPVIFVLLVINERANLLQLRSLADVIDRLTIGPARPRKSLPEIIELGLQHPERGRLDGVGHHRLLLMTEHECGLGTG